MTLAVASRNFGLSRVNPKKSIKLSISECEYFSSSCRTYPETLEGIKLMLPKNKKSFSSQVKHIAQDPPNYVTQGRVLPLLSDLKLFSMCMTNSARTSQRNLTKKKKSVSLDFTVQVRWGQSLFQWYSSCKKDYSKLPCWFLPSKKSTYFRIVGCLFLKLFKNS